MCNNTKKYTIKQFREDYPTEEICLDKVFKLVYKDLIICPKCNCSVTYKRVSTRRCYQCPKCYNQLYPTAGTIFEKSTTPLMYWFYAIFLFTASKNGLSAMELQRQIGVTYKTAFRMLKQIRSMIKEDSSVMSGIKRVAHSQGRSYKDKVPVFGILQRGGKVRAFTVDNVKSETLRPMIYSNIQKGSSIMTDEWTSYSGLSKHYNHEIVYHGRGQYVNGNCYTNGLENFWSIVKRTINGSYIHVSGKYMQYYINECVFRFNNRDNKQIFNQLVSCLSS